MSTANPRKSRRLTAVVSLLAAFLTTTASQAEDSGAEPADGERLFTLRVLPLIQAKCFGCHGEKSEDVRGEYNLLTREGMLQGGESGEPSLVPGKPEESSLYQAVLWEGYEMPPKENDRLTETETEYIRAWIAAGAPWPDAAARQKIREAQWAVEVNADGKIVRTSGGTTDEWTHRRYQPQDIWAFEKVRPKSQLLPSEVSTEEAIDEFVGRRLAKADIEPTTQAAPRTLIRRATLDLTGLPPTPEEIEAFEAAWSKGADKAWPELVDRLLASPRYGEHWARQWLDVTRYADTGGMSNDFERSNMWRYRDFVIRAFNEDKPYNEFIVEQLAGDELADQSMKERTGGSRAEVHKAQLAGSYTDQEAEWIVATGFLRLGPWDNAMVEADEARQIYLDDLVNITGQTFLSTTLRCCKCHDHKFDPLPTRDYYRIYAAFSTTQMAERPVPLLPTESQEGFEEGRAHVQRMLDFAVTEKNRLIEKREAAARAWFEERGLPYKNQQQRTNLPDEEKPPRHVGLNHVEQGQLKVREQDEWIWGRRLERYQPMAQSVYNAASVNLAWNGARKLRIDQRRQNQQPAANHILTGGALTALGDVVHPGVLSVIDVARGSCGRRSVPVDKRD